MTYFTHTLALTGLIASLGTGVFAKDVDPATVTCRDFTAMSSEDQTSAMVTLKAAQKDAKTATSTDSSTAADSPAATDTTASTDSATSTDSAATDSTATKSDTTASTETDNSAGAMADPEMDALKKSCEGNDDALVMDHMGSM